jgi:hypothetical protein
MICICPISSSSLCIKSETSTGTGSIVVSLLVMHVVVSSTKVSPGLTCSATPSTETNMIQSNFSPSAVKSNWFSKSQNVWDAHPLVRSHTGVSREKMSGYYPTPRIILLYDILIAPIGVQSCELSYLNIKFVSDRPEQYQL